MGNMWNEYVKAVQSRGLRPSYQQFVDQYSTLQNLANYNVINTLQSAGLSGMTDKQIKKQIKNNPELRQQLLEIVKKTPSAKAGEIGYKELAAGYLTKEQTKTEWMQENPLKTLGGGAAAIWAANKYLRPKIAETYRGFTTPTPLSFEELKGQKIPKDIRKKALDDAYDKYEKKKGRKAYKNRTEWNNSAKPKDIPEKWGLKGSKDVYKMAQETYGPEKLKAEGLAKKEGWGKQVMAKTKGKGGKLQTALNLLLGGKMAYDLAFPDEE